MKINKRKIFGKVEFEKQDAEFLKQYGSYMATRLVLEHYKKYDAPFIKDTYQLAHTLAVSRKILFDISRDTNLHYTTRRLPKKSGGFRVIDSPDEELKHIQKMILNRILNQLEISPYATAYIKGRRLRDNAAPHVNHKYLLKMDITDFFGSITYLQVISAAFNSKIYPVQIGAMLTTLCCKNEVLPQGAPTSPMLSNIVMRNFDNYIGKWCEKRGITYTRYCDDLTFSADTPLYGVYNKVSNILCDNGFEVNESKTKFITNSSRQTVTGLTVNEKVSIPADYKRNLRQEVYYALKFGLADSIIKGDKKDYIKDGEPDTNAYYHHLRGKINYVLQIAPDEWFATKANELKKLQK